MDPGGAVGVTALESADAGPVPTLFVATTKKSYETPGVSPVTVQLSVVDVQEPTVTLVEVVSAETE